VVRKRVIVLGDVQGVYFRDTCQRRAAEHRVAGWVRNLPDGTVEAVFEGEPGGVAQMVDWVHRGPARASVDGVEVYDEQPEGLTGFTITRMPGRIRHRP
jgi:acylphosphatase